MSDEGVRVSEVLFGVFFRTKRGAPDERMMHLGGHIELGSDGVTVFFNKELVLRVPCSAEDLGEYRAALGLVSAQDELVTAPKRIFAWRHQDTGVHGVLEFRGVGSCAFTVKVFRPGTKDDELGHFEVEGRAVKKAWGVSASAA